MTDEAIVLAGGLGTRLREVIGDFPKPMAGISGKPFLEYLLTYLGSQGVKRIILSIGYKGEQIEEYFKGSFRGIEIQYSKEEEPLGTGGGIKLASKRVESDRCFILNGDSFYDVQLDELEALHLGSGSLLSLSLKPMKKFDRYGTVETNDEGRIIAFKEKQALETGLINGGVYCCEKNIWDSLETPEKFSFEKDLLEKYHSQKSFYGFSFDKYFIDIGIPEDYERAQKEIPEKIKDKKFRN